MFEWMQARLPQAQRRPIGFALAIRPVPGAPLHAYPHPGRRTMRSDGALRKAAYFRLTPWEAPMVPLAGVYAVVLYDETGAEVPTPVSMQGGILIAHPSPQVQVSDGWVLP